MATKVEIDAAVAALQQEAADARQAAADLVEKSRAADKLDALADNIEVSNEFLLKSGENTARFEGPGVGAQVVTFLRTRAQAIRDAIVLPAP